MEWIFSTQPADRERAEEGVRYTYRAAGVPEPKIFLWFHDLVEAMLAAEQLWKFRESNWMLPTEALRRREETQQRVSHTLGLGTWDEVVEAVGPLHTQYLHEKRQHRGMTMMVAVPRRDSLQAGLRTMPDDPPCDCDAIEHAATAIRRAYFAYWSELRDVVERCAGPGPPGHRGIGCLSPIYQDYWLPQLFRHDCLLNILGEPESAQYHGLCLTVEHGGPWWAFANAAILCDRPRVTHRDSEARLHHETGPAVVFGNGVELFAWHGSWVPEAAIRNPESLTRPAIKAENDPKVREALIQIYGAERDDIRRTL